MDRRVVQTKAATRQLGPDDGPRILEIVNAAAERYRGVIPADRWHEPYMSAQELEQEMKHGVEFTGLELEGRLFGVMGIQRSRNVRLIRHAYVAPAKQGRGVGSELLALLAAEHGAPVLIGTWRAATWAIAFYRSHGFASVPEDAIAPLLRTYWSIPDRQVETSVVLARPHLTLETAGHLIAAAEGPDGIDPSSD